MSFQHYIKILRPFNCIMSAVAVFIGFSVALGSIGFSFPLLLAMLSAVLICGAGQAINDYFDRETDSQLKPEKPIPAGEIKAKNALIYSIVLFAAGVIISYFINFSAFAIALVFSLLLIVYSATMQKLKFLGNWVVAMGTAFTLIYGASVIGNYSVVLFLAASALLVNVGREITKDVEDIKGDRGFKKTLPMLLGRKSINAIVLVLYTTGILVALAAFIIGRVKAIIYAVLIIASGLLFYYSFYLLERDKLHPSQQFSKYAMLAALLAFIAGVL